MEKYLNNYFSAMEKSGKRSKNTIEAYYRDARQFVVFLNVRQITDPSLIDRECVTDYVEELWRMGRSRSTMNRKLSAVRAFLEFLRKEGAVNDLAVSVRAPRVEAKAAEYLTIEEMETLLAQPDESLRGLRDRALLELMYGTGVRVSEVIEMKIEQINTGIGFCTLGGEHGRARIIPMGRLCRQAVEKYLQEARPKLLEIKKRSGKKAAEEYLFVNFRGEKLTRQGLWKIISGYAESAGLQEKASPQILRHSFAVHMLQNGADIRALQELMGVQDAAALQMYISSSKVRIKEVFDRAHPRA